MRGKSRELLVRHAPPSTCTGAAATSCANRGKAAEGGQHTGHPRLLQRLRHLRWLHRSVWAAWLHGGWRQLPLAYVLTKRGLGMAASPRESALPGGHLQELPVRSQVVWRKDSQVLTAGHMAPQDADGCILSPWSGSGPTSLQQACKELAWRDGDRAGGPTKAGTVLRWGAAWDSETGSPHGCQDLPLG